MEEKLIELLESIGLSKNEIEVYLDLLKNRASTAYLIAHRINQHRSSVYDALRKLQQKGFIVEIQEAKRKLYQTKEYTAIEEYLKQKYAELISLTPYLKEVANIEMPQSSISVSYGLTRLRTLFSSFFDLKTDILIWTLPKNFGEIFGEWFLRELNEKAAKHNINVKIIFSSQTNKEIIKTNLIEAKYLEDDSNIFTISCGDVTTLVVLGDQVSLIEIKNKDVSEGFKKRFFTFWEKAKKE